MADWYVSSVNYAALSAWVVSTAYTVGQFIKPTAPNATNSYVYRCTTAGTTSGSEPNWAVAAPTNNSTVTSGTAVFTNVSGQSAYGWTAAAGAYLTLCGASGSSRPAASTSDRVFIASDHSETISSGTATYNINAEAQAFGLVRVISVNRAGSVPPVEADLLSGAVFTNNGSNGFTLEAYCDVYWQGISFVQTTASNLTFNTTNGKKAHYFRNCSLAITNASTDRFLTAGAVRVTLDNTTLQFGATAGIIGNNTSSTLFELYWINTSSALGGSTFPTTLFNNNSTGASLQVICRGVDLSAITGTLVAIPTQGQNTRVLLDSCKIASSVTRIGAPATGAVANDELELVNCYDGTNILNERYTAAGAVTTDRSTYMTGGAQDNVGAYSIKLVSSTRSDYCTLPLDSFWLDVGNTATGSSKTATVEIVSSASLNNIDIKLLLEYADTSGSPVADFLESLSSVLAASSALPTSSVTWTNPPATPVKQYLRVTFTPQTAGRVRGLVRLGKTSTTVWVNPQITIA